MIAFYPNPNAPPSDSALSGLNALANALQTKPTLTLTFYPYGIILHRNLPDGGETEYAVSPKQLAEAISPANRFETGLLNTNTLSISTEGTKRSVTEYRPPANTAVFFEGSENPLFVPLPGLILNRLTTGDDSPQYSIFAVKQRPADLNAPLFCVPLPNISTGRTSSICWGSVAKPSAETLASNTLEEDWRLLLGSRFSNHSVYGKSKRYKDDIRRHLIALNDRKARKYPLSDLITAHTTLGALLKDGHR
jgi:hypothetical protein